MTPYLLVDFGTSSTKSTVVDLDTGALARPLQHDTVRANAPASGRSEVPLDSVRTRFLDVCRRACDTLPVPLAGVQTCSEMHGFAVLDSTGAPLTPYIGWGDARCTEPIAGETTLDLVSRVLEPDFEGITGMRPRAGLALLNLIHLGRQGLLPREGHVVSLPGWLSRCTGGAVGIDHPSLLASMAAFDVNRKVIAERLVTLVRDLGRFEAHFDAPARAGERAGRLQIGRARVPLHVGVGDHQCSVLGAGLVRPDALSLNLGTGSQVSVLAESQRRNGSCAPCVPSGPASSQVERSGAEVRESSPACGPADSQLHIERRPYFGDRILKTVTHVPAGRALSVFIRLLQEAAGDRVDLWEKLTQLDARQVQAGDLTFDLRIFAGAGGSETGSIGGIREDNLHAANYLASLLRCFCDQYPAVCRRLDPEMKLHRLLLGGGLARRLPAVKQLMQQRMGYQVRGAADLDESLLGLRALALVDAGRVSDPLAAWLAYGSECRFSDALNAEGGM